MKNMEHKKMTSVDFFISEILKHDKSFVEFYGAEIEQLRAMHKSETILFVETMPAYIDIGKEGGFYVKYNAEEHYNKTFNNGTDIN